MSARRVSWRIFNMAPHSLRPWTFSLALAGHAIGSRLFKRLPVARYQGLLVLIIVAAGTVSVVAGATAS